MAFYSNFDTLFTRGRVPATVLSYTNNTKKRLYINRLDILPDVYAAKYGRMEVLKNGITEFKSRRSDGETDVLRRYLQYSIADRLRVLDRFETLEIILWADRDEITVKAGLALVLDFEQQPAVAANLSRDPISLTFLSEDILLANKRLFSAEQTSLHFIPFTNVGYDTMLLLITVDAPFGAPSLIYNRANPPPASWFADMVGSYRGNSGALERRVRCLSIRAAIASKPRAGHMLTAPLGFTGT